MISYQQAIDYIHSANRFGIKLGLANTERLMHELGDPHLKLKFVHIAGTNGKGSTASFIAHGLMAAGYRVGRYISPYIEVFNERIQIDDDYISNDDLASCTARVKAAVAVLNSEGIQPTEFEIVTAIGLIYFLNQAVDVVVLEVGMGGRFDSTNVIKTPLATVITPVSMDHMAYLGDTIEKIAFEKAGIIKPNCFVVSSQHNQRAAAVIADIAGQKNADYHVSDWQLAADIFYDDAMTYFNYKDQAYTIRMLGWYQVQNACTAIDTLHLLNQETNLTITQANIMAGLAKATWRGRFEIIHRQPTVVIDGAHNIDAIKQFDKSIDVYFANKKRIAIFGIMADKAVDEILDLIADQFDTFYLVAPDNPRALTVEELADKLRANHFNGDIVSDLAIAEIAQLIKQDQAADVVYLAFGSLYFIGELRKCFI